MKRLLRSPYSPIGVDLDGQFIKAVQLVSRAGKREIHAATTLRRARPGAMPDAGEIRRFAQVLGRNGFHGRRIVLGVPSDQIVSAVLELPPAHTGAPRDQIATVELAATHRRDPGSLTAAFWELPKKPREGGVYALAVGCDQESAETLLDLFEAERLEVLALDAPVLALARAVGRESNEMVGIVRMGWSGAQIGVVRDGTVLFERGLADAGLHRVHDGLIEEMDIDVDVAHYLIHDVGLSDGAVEGAENTDIVEQVRDRITQYLEVLDQEIALSLSYIRQEYPDDPILRLLLVGDAAAVPGVETAFSKIRKTPCRTISPADIVSGGGDVAKSPVIGTAFGLAMYEDAA